MSEEVSIHGGVVRVTDASVIGQTIYNRVKAENFQGRLSVHFQTDGVTAPGPREALLVAILSGVHPQWLETHGVGGDTEAPVDINFRADSAVTRGGNFPERATQTDAFHMSEISSGHKTRLHLKMTDMSANTVHAVAVLNKWQVTQMIAALLALYPRLHED